MFRGVTLINLDEKNRMAVPTRYRERLQREVQGQLVITIDTESRCLLLYPLINWEHIEEKIEALPSFNEAARRIQRLLLGHATDVEMDSAGRVLIPPPLREYAMLEKNIVLVGQGKKFEIWNGKHWDKARDNWIELGLKTEGPLPAELGSISL